MRLVSMALGCALAILGCGPRSAGVRSGATSTSATLCAGWMRHRALGGTSIAFPGPAHIDQQGNDTSIVHGEGIVYLQVDERVMPGLEGGSDRSAIDGVLAGLGDPSRAQLQAGWRVVSQGLTEVAGRPAAERVIDVEGQILRREWIVRAGNTMLLITTMVRHDRVEESAPILRCFERALVFAAPPSP